MFHERPPSEFEHAAFEVLYARALRDVADRRLDESTRKAASRALAFLIREGPTERVVTDVLNALHRSLDIAKIVRTLLLGLRNGVGNHERTETWTRAVVDRALRDEQLTSFVSALRVLVDFSNYDGVVPARWRLSILRAASVPELAPRVLLFTRGYRRRFPEQSWRWIRQAHVRSTIACLKRRAIANDFEEAETA